MRKSVLSALIVLFALCHKNMNSQTLANSQNSSYPYGYMASNMTDEDVQNEYLNYKNTFLVACNNYVMPTVDISTRSASTAVGQAMLISVYQGDKQVYDKLWGFYKSKRRSEAYNLMAWDVTCDSVLDRGSCPEGDIDVAFSLIVAQDQWGGTYLNEAKTIIDLIKKSVVTTCSGLYVICAGYKNSAWGGCNETCLAYYSPAFFRVFASVTNDAIWTTLANDSYLILGHSANPSKGLYPDWQRVNGDPGPSGYGEAFGYDACRFIWRMALDYLWNGNSNSRTWCTRISNWANEIGAANIKDGYHLDGTVSGYSNNSTFVGCLAVGAMCNSQTIVDSFSGHLKGLSDSFWLNGSMRMTCKQVLSGKYWKPDLSTGLHPSKESNIHIFSDPVTGVTTIEGIANFEKLEIINLAGNVIVSRKILSENKIQISMAAFSNGIYVVKVSDQSGAAEYKRFLKH